MPKEEACFGEHAPRSSSKNAKDKSNSAALLASRGRTGTGKGPSGRGSRCGSEKDSGYSDTGSDSLQTTDGDDLCGNASKPRAGGRGPGQGGGGDGHSGSLHGSSTPVYILKNVVLKQPLTVQPGLEQPPNSQLVWGSGGLAAPLAPAQLLFIQPPGATGPAGLHLLKPQPKKGGNVNGIGKGSYLPILNSYPRIAPHPSRKTSEQDKGGEGNRDHSVSKRVCTEERREAVSTTSQILKRLQESKGHSLSHTPGSGPVGPQQCSDSRPPPNSRGLNSPSVSSSDATPSPAEAAPRRSRKHNPGRQRRFLNTVEILSQSGLLDITMRTQELLRQNTATESDIDLLRHHAQLLCLAAQASPEDGGAAWDKLCQAMAGSGRYPGLNLHPEAQCHCQSLEGEVQTNGKSNPVVTVFHYNHGDEAVPPSPLLAPTPEPHDYSGVASTSPTYPATGTPPHGRVHRAKSPPDAVMPADSSAPSTSGAGFIWC